MKKIRLRFGKKIFKKGAAVGGAPRPVAATQPSAHTDELKAAQAEIADLEKRLVKAEVNLKKCLEEKETARLESMRAVFEALSVKQESSDTFLADAQRAFDKITEMQSDPSLTVRDIATNAHALVLRITADALSMGLLSFGNYLQQFADTIEEISQLKTPAFSDELRLTAQMEQILQEKDKLVESVKKLRSGKNRAMMIEKGFICRISMPKIRMEAYC